MNSDSESSNSDCSNKDESKGEQKYEFIPLDMDELLESARNEPLPEVLPMEDDDDEEIEDIPEELANISEESENVSHENYISERNRQPLEENLLDDTLGCRSIETPIKTKQVVYTSLPSETSKKIESKRLAESSDFGIRRLSLYTPIKHDTVETLRLKPRPTIQLGFGEPNRGGMSTATRQTIQLGFSESNQGKSTTTPLNCARMNVVISEVPPQKIFRTPIQPASLIKPREPATTSKIPIGHIPEPKFSKVFVRGRTYLIMKVLGRGGSSEVYQCFDHFNKVNRAVKSVNLDSPSAMSFLKEVEVLGKLQNCDHIIKVYDYEHLVNEKKLYVVMEMGSADLSQILKDLSSNENRISPPYLILFYWMEMLRAVSQLHKHAIIHSDLKPANFLLVNGRLKLIDFGISSCVQNDSTSIIKTVSEGSCNYISPEALNCEYSANVASPNYGKPKYKISYKSDVWSLGCILYQLVYRKTPFQHIVHPMKKLMAIANPNMTIEYPDKWVVPDKFIRTIKKCLIFSAKSRASVDELIAEYEQFDKV